MLKSGDIFRDLLQLFFPDFCPGCEEAFLSGQHYLCLSCRGDLPFCRFSCWPGNPLETLLEGRVDYAAACSLLYFEKKGRVQKMVHALKYHGRQEMGLMFGALLAEEMLQSGRFGTVDCVVQVPLHPDKLRKRGYNQTATFADRLSREMGSSLCHGALSRMGPITTQTSMDRSQRAELLNSCFYLSEGNRLAGKHVLLVDDVATTGATLESCANALLQVPGVRLSIATMAFAR